jgi:hypothetical protein
LDAPHQELLGARAAGMGGLEVAVPPGVEALLYNPAGLAGASVQSGAFGAADPGQRGQAGFGLSAPVDDSLRLGFYAAGLRDNGLDALAAQTLALLGAFEVRPGATLGLRGLMHQLQVDGAPGPVRGASLDLGWQARGLHWPGLPGQWAWGLSADHVLGWWQDPAWDLALPVVGRAGLSYDAAPGWSAGFQVDATAAAGAGQGPLWAWRGGLQWECAPALALRGGWSDDGRQGLLSAGLSVDGAGPHGPGLDWALLSPPQGGGLSQRLDLRWAWAFEPRAPLGVEAEQLLIDPGTGLVRSALLAVTLSPLLRQRPWRVELLDADGKLWRTLVPLDPQDPYLAWDGLDGRGRALPPPPGLRAELVVEDGRGGLRAPAQRSLEASAQRIELARQDRALPALKFTPVFEDASEGQLSHVDIQLPALRASSWRMEIQDAQHHPLRQLKGLGDPPSDLVWDGRDADGLKVGESLGVQMRLEVVDRQGRETVQSLPLFTQRAFAFAQRAIRQSPELRLASLGLDLFLGRPGLNWQADFLPAMTREADQRARAGLLLGRLDGGNARRERYQRQAGPATEMDLFDLGGSAIVEARLDLLATWSRRLGGATELWVRGLARKDEANAEALAYRRAEALVRALRAQGQGEGLELVLQAPGAPGDFKGVRLELRAAAEANALPPSTAALAQADPSQLGARYQPIEEPPGLGDDLPAPPPGPWQRWTGSAKDAVTPAWCPAIGKLAFFQDGWIWVTDRQGSVLRSLWFDPGLAAAGRLVWDPAGAYLWIRADRWRGWLSLRIRLAA